MMVAPISHADLTLSQLLPENSLPAAIANTPVTGITIDSREVKPGYLFVAVPGLTHHGKDFADAASNAGAIALLIDQIEANFETSIPVIGIENLAEQLSAIAGRLYGNPSAQIPVFGITGTNGKTTCTQLLAQLLGRMGTACGVMGTLGVGVVTPEIAKKAGALQTVLSETGMTTTDAARTQRLLADLAEQGAESIAMEVSSHGLEQGRVAAVDINIAVFTNLTHDHLDYHQTMEAYGNAKAKLFAMPSVKAAVINQDDAFGRELINRFAHQMPIATYSVSDGKSVLDGANHFSFSDFKMTAGGLEANLQTPQGRFSITTSLAGEFNLSNLLAVIGALYMAEVSLPQCLPLINQLQPVSGRMELIQNRLGLQVVVDYAHTPDALANALQALKAHVDGKLWCVFGCGGDRDRAKRPLMAKVAEQFADEVVVTSDNPRTESPVQIFADIEEGFVTPREVIADRASAIEFAISNAEKGDVVLIAGKGHENYQILGKQKIHFSDQQQARLYLRQREAEDLR